MYLFWFKTKQWTKLLEYKKSSYKITKKLCTKLKEMKIDWKKINKVYLSYFFKFALDNYCLLKYECWMR